MRLTNRPVPVGMSSSIGSTMSPRHAPIEHVEPEPQPLPQSEVGVTQLCGSVAAEPATHSVPAAHRPAHVPTAVAIVEIVQSDSVGALLLARASWRLVTRWPMPSSTPSDRYAIAGLPLPSIVIDAKSPTSLLLPGSTT